MANNSGSKWFQKSRINVDTDLLFNGIDQRVVANPLPFEFGTTDFSFSFFYEDKSLNGINGYFSINKPGGAISFQIRDNSGPNQYQCSVNPSNRLIIGGSVHKFKSGNFSPLKLNVKKHIVVTRTGVNIIFYINGQKLELFDVINPLQLTDEFDFNSGLEYLIIGAVSDAGGAPTNITSSHNQVFSKALSEEEIRYIYVNGGIIPESAHQYVLAHYPLQSICNVDGSLFTMDAVEQYNYTKYKYLDIQEPSTSDFNTPTNGATLTGGSDSDGVYVQFDAGDPMVNSQDLSFLAFNGPLFDEPNTSGELGQTMVTKLKFKIANGSSTRIKVSRSFITTSILSEITDGSNIQELEIRDNIPSEGTGRDLIFNYSISDSSPITSSIRFYGIEYYMERKAPLIANNAIPINFTPNDSSTVTTIFETIPDASAGSGTAITSTVERLAQTFQLSQDLSNDFILRPYIITDSSTDVDLDLHILGVIGDVSSGKPYITEVIAQSDNTIDLGPYDSSPGHWLPFNFSGVTLQDGSMYAAMLVPSNVTDMTGLGWNRKQYSDIYENGIGWFSSNSGITWINTHGDPSLDFAMEIQEITTTAGSNEFDKDAFRDFYTKNKKVDLGAKDPRSLITVTDPSYNNGIYNGLTDPFTFFIDFHAENYYLNNRNQLLYAPNRFYISNSNTIIFQHPINSYLDITSLDYSILGKRSHIFITVNPSTGKISSGAFEENGKVIGYNTIDSSSFDIGEIFRIGYVSGGWSLVGVGFRYALLKEELSLTDIKNLYKNYSLDFDFPGYQTIFKFYHDTSSNLIDYSGNNNTGIHSLSGSWARDASLFVEPNSLMPSLNNTLYFDESKDHYLESLDDFQIPFEENGQYTVQFVFKPIGEWPSSTEDGFTFAFYNNIASDANFGMQLRGNEGIYVFYDDPSSGPKTTNIQFNDTYINPNDFFIFTILIDNSSKGFGGRFGGTTAGDSTQFFINGIFKPDSGHSSSLAKLRFDLFTPNRSLFGHSSFQPLTNPGWNGYIVSYDVYNKALSDKELLELANNTLMKRPNANTLGDNLKFSIDFQNPIFDSSSNAYVYKDKVYNHRFRERNYDTLQSLENNTIPICEIRDNTTGNTPITQLNIWGDEIDQPIVTEKDDNIEVP